MRKKEFQSGLEDLAAGAVCGSAMARRSLRWPAACLGGATLCLLAAAASAQTSRFDTAVAAEVMRGTVAAQAAGAMRDNQQLILDYQNVAIEQELAREAAARGLAERLDVGHALEQSRRQILVQALREDLARGVPSPAEKDSQAAYQKDPGRWALPEAYQLDVLQLDGTDAKGLREARALANGKPVSDAALQPLKVKVLGTQASGNWISAAQLAPEIWTNLPAMRQGTVRVFDLNGATLLIRRGMYREMRALSYEQVKGQIEMELRRVKEDAAWQQYLAKKRKELGL